MIAIEHQQGAIRAQVECVDQRAEQCVGIGDVAGILANRIVRLRKTPGTVGIMRFHGYRHGKQRLPEFHRLLDLADQRACHRTIADIRAEAVRIGEGILADEAIEAELRNGAVAAKEAGIVRVQEERAPAPIPQPRRERRIGKPAWPHIGVEAIHPLHGEGDSGEHLHLRTVRVGTEARDLQPSRGQRASAQLVEGRQLRGDPIAAYVAEGLGLYEDHGAITVAELARSTVRMRHARLLGPPQRDAGDQRCDEADIGNTLAARGVAEGSECGDASCRRAYQQHRRDTRADRQNDRLHAAPEEARLPRAPADDQPDDGCRKERNPRQFAPAEIEQCGVTDQRRDEAEIAEHQRLTQVAVLHPRNACEHRDRHQGCRRGEEGACRDTEPESVKRGQSGGREAQHGRRTHELRARHALGIDGKTNGQRHDETGRNNTGRYEELIHHSQLSPLSAEIKIIKSSTIFNIYYHDYGIKSSNKQKNKTHVQYNTADIYQEFTADCGQMETEACHE